MEKRRSTKPAPTRSEAYQSALFAALAAAFVALMTLKLLLGLAFGAAAVVAVVGFIFFFGMALRLTPRRRED